MWESVADAIPDRPGGHERRRDAHVGATTSIGPPASRPRSRRRPRARAKVGIYLYNGNEYLEAHSAAFKIRGVPVNVNYRYLDDELVLPARQLRRRGARVPRLARRPCRRVVDRLPKLKLLVEVDDAGDGDRSAARASPTRTLIAAHEPSRGSTRDGRRPLHALHRRHDRHAEGRDVRASARSRRPHAARVRRVGLPSRRAGRRRAVVAERRAAGRTSVSVPARPLMHGTGLVARRDDAAPRRRSRRHADEPQPRCRRAARHASSAIA